MCPVHKRSWAALAVRLSAEELRSREATLLAQFKSAVIATNELANGYSFRVPGEKKWLAIVAELIGAERECCPFMTFQLTTEPNMGSLTLAVTGPAGTKEFLKTIFF